MDDDAGLIDLDRIEASNVSLWDSRDLGITTHRGLVDTRQTPFADDPSSASSVGSRDSGGLLLDGGGALGGARGGEDRSLWPRAGHVPMTGDGNGESAMPLLAASEPNLAILPLDEALDDVQPYLAEGIADRTPSPITEADYNDAGDDDTSDEDEGEDDGGGDGDGDSRTGKVLHGSGDEAVLRNDDVGGGEGGSRRRRDAIPMRPQSLVQPPALPFRVNRQLFNSTLAHQQRLSQTKHEGRAAAATAAAAVTAAVAAPRLGPSPAPSPSPSPSLSPSLSPSQPPWREKQHAIPSRRPSHLRPPSPVAASAALPNPELVVSLASPLSMSRSRPAAVETATVTTTATTSATAAMTVTAAIDVHVTVHAADDAVGSPPGPIPITTTALPVLRTPTRTDPTASESPAATRIHLSGLPSPRSSSWMPRPTTNQIATPPPARRDRRATVSSSSRLPAPTGTSPSPRRRGMLPARPWSSQALHAPAPATEARPWPSSPIARRLAAASPSASPVVPAAALSPSPSSSAAASPPLPTSPAASLLARRSIALTDETRVSPPTVAPPPTATSPARDVTSASPRSCAASASEPVSPATRWSRIAAPTTLSRPAAARPPAAADAAPGTPSPTRSASRINRIASMGRLSSTTAGPRRAVSAVTAPAGTAGAMPFGRRRSDASLDAAGHAARDERRSLASARSTPLLTPVAADGAATPPEASTPTTAAGALGGAYPRSGLPQRRSTTTRPSNPSSRLPRPVSSVGSLVFDSADASSRGSGPGGVRTSGLPRPMATATTATPRQGSAPTTVDTPSALLTLRSVRSLSPVE